MWEAKRMTFAVFPDVRRWAFMVLTPVLLAAILAGCALSEADEHCNAGVELHESGRLDEAIGEYDEALRLNSEYAKAFYNRPDAYMALGKYERFVQDLDESIRLNPTFGDAYNNRALPIPPSSGSGA